MVFLPPDCTNKTTFCIVLAASGLYYDTIKFANPLNTAQCICLTYTLILYPEAILLTLFLIKLLFLHTRRHLTQPIYVQIGYPMRG